MFFKISNHWAVLGYDKIFQNVSSNYMSGILTCLDILILSPGRKKDNDVKLFSENWSYHKCRGTSHLNKFP